jgi:hypothetical protein
MQEVQVFEEFMQFSHVESHSRQFC